MADNKILIDDFINEYKSIQASSIKAKKIASIVNRTYCPILEKKIILETMLQNSIVNSEIKYIDMFTNRINMVGAVVVLYTNLVPGKDKNGKPKIYEMYDLLIENDILNSIYEIIGKRELDELLEINRTILDTWHNQNDSLEAFLNTQIRKASEVLGLLTQVDTENIKNTMLDFFENENKTINEKLTSSEEIDK